VSIRCVALKSAFYPPLARRVAPMFEARQAIFSAARKHHVRKEEL
jgi:hypothetical protein